MNNNIKTGKNISFHMIIFSIELLFNRLCAWIDYSFASKKLWHIHIHERKKSNLVYDFCLSWLVVAFPRNELYIICVLNLGFKNEILTQRRKKYCHRFVSCFVSFLFCSCIGRHSVANYQYQGYLRVQISHKISCVRPLPFVSHVFMSSTRCAYACAIRCHSECALSFWNIF